MVETKALRSIYLSARSQFLRILRHAARSYEGKWALVEPMRTLFRWRPEELSGLSGKASPYPDLGRVPGGAPTSERDDIVIITARFRSGSTLLWNLFRHIKGCTSYYEPFNERRWFDPACRGARVDATHREVSDYWREYEGLDDLGADFSDEWTDRGLYMDAGAWNPAMKRYVERLIEHAPGRPVLQFNRIDFRLPWIRRQFPNAKIVHMYRHPRDQWCSALGDLGSFPPGGRLADFRPHHDRFYLLPWAEDLKVHFPFLAGNAASHPYEVFYYLWKLSWLYGVKYADHSLSFESLVDSPRERLGELFGLLRMEAPPMEPLLSIISAPPSGRWRQYAPEGWFREIESRCESVLREFLGPPRPNSPAADGGRSQETALALAS